MPTSWYQAIPHILDLLQSEQPRSILDIGVGFGKYGLLIRDTLEIPFERYTKQQWICQVDGIEAFANYRNPIHDYVYNKVYYNDVKTIIHDLPTYDLILLIDVIEHFEKEEGYVLINELLEHTNKCLIISTPLYPAKQKDYNGNYYEEHKSRWFITDFISFDYSFKYVPIGNNGAQLYNIFKTQYMKDGNDYADDIVSITSGLDIKSKLKIGYLLPHKNLTGGMKMLLENMRMMKSLGHRVYAFLKGAENEEIIPNWYNDIEIDKKVIVPFGQPFSSYIEGCDVIIAGWMSQIEEAVSTNTKVPIIYWEQGSEFLFGDYNDIRSESKTRTYLKKCFSFPVSIVSCSPTVAEILSVRYGRKSFVIPNGIDTDFYYPSTKSDMKDDGETNILLVGNPQLRFKGFDVALNALQIVYEKGYKFKVNWVCQVLPNIKGVTYPINYIQMPTQEKLAEIYRNSDIFIFSSWYEGFGMPPLEALASGVPVISTKCGGIESFIKPGFNGLLVEPGDIDSLAYGIIELISNRKLRKLLSERGRQTALDFDAKIIAKKWEEYLYNIVEANK